MGFFSRGTRPEQDLIPDAPPRVPEPVFEDAAGEPEVLEPQDRPAERATEPAPEPDDAAREPVSEPEAPAAEAATPEAPEVESEAPEVESEAPEVESEATTPEVEPEPVAEPAATVPAPERAPARPPANPVPPEAEGEEVRITASEAIAPRRDPSRPAQPADSMPPKRAKVISFANQKGGVAKTTSTLNLAVAFAESGHDVLAIDLDPQGNLTMSQGIDPDKVDKSMFDVLVHHTPLREVIQEREIDIAVASIDLAGAEIAMSTQIGRERSLEKAIKAVEDDYDFICIDTPPSLGLLTVNALTASDKVIVPVQCEYLSMRGLLQLQNTLDMIRENLNPRVEIEGILPTMLDSRTVHAKEAVQILEENFGDLVFKSRIKKAIKFAEAPVRGSSLLKYDPKSNAADYYRELAEEVLTHGAP
jgi:chromosome partitioning protein